MDTHGCDAPSVGIGTDDPSGRLHVLKGGTTSIIVESTTVSSAKLNLKNTTSEWSVINEYALNGKLGFNLNSIAGVAQPDASNTKMVIDLSGNVGIGTNDPRESYGGEAPPGLGPGEWGRGLTIDGSGTAAEVGETTDHANLRLYASDGVGASGTNGGYTDIFQAYQFLSLGFQRLVYGYLRPELRSSRSALSITGSQSLYWDKSCAPS